MAETLNPPSRAIYFEKPSSVYARSKRVNQLSFDEEYARKYFLSHAQTIDTTNGVRIVPMSTRTPAEMIAGAMEELKLLRHQGRLTALRGGRLTDLARPLSAAVRQEVVERAPNLVRLVREVERATVGGDLFVRTIKFDEARMSTTQASSDKSLPNLHFDNAPASLAKYPGPIDQFYANVSQQPRQFRVLPIPRPEMIGRLQQLGVLNAEEALTTPLGRILELFQENFDQPLEEMVIESGQLAIFDGRFFAHDAGKAAVGPRQKGHFVPSVEPDLIVAFDDRRSGFHEGLYDPNLSFLEDPGTPAWWEMMAKISQKAV